MDVMKPGPGVAAAVPAVLQQLVQYSSSSQHQQQPQSDLDEHSSPPINIHETGQAAHQVDISMSAALRMGGQQAPDRSRTPQRPGSVAPPLAAQLAELQPRPPPPETVQV